LELIKNCSRNLIFKFDNNLENDILDERELINFRFQLLFDSKDFDKEKLGHLVNNKTFFNVV